MKTGIGIGIVVIALAMIMIALTYSTSQQPPIQPPNTVVDESAAWLARAEAASETCMHNAILRFAAQGYSKDQIQTLSISACSGELDNLVAAQKAQVK